MVPPRLTKGTRAAAIMLALWALFLLSAMVISWALDINTRLTISGSANRLLEAEAMACSGAEVALHPSVKPGSPVLHGSFPSNQSYETRITGEGGRLNINKIVAAGLADPNSPYLVLLRKYLEVKGVDLNDRDHMIDCLLDWIDPDNLVRLNGAEDEPGYKPSNAPLKTLDEMKRIKGWEEFATRPDWDADFTLNPLQQDAKIDIMWASRDVLLALPGMTEGQVDRFLSLRRGPDDIEGTEDDGFQDPSLALLALGISPQKPNELANLVTTTSPVVRIVSVGRSAGVTRTVQVVVLKSGPRLISWKESGEDFRPQVVG